MRKATGCSVAGCTAAHIAKGYCWKHYQRVRAHGDPHAFRPPGPAAKVRARRMALFWTQLEQRGDCWHYVGSRGGQGEPYGRHVVDGKSWLVHRLSWEEMVGPIPDGLTIDHLCRNTRCVNPDHLEPVPGSVNTARAHRDRNKPAAA